GRGLVAGCDGRGVVADVGARMDERRPDDAEGLVHESVTLGAIAAVVGRIIELDRDDRSERYLVAEHEVHVLGGHTVEGRLIYLTVGDLAELPDTDLQKDEETAGNGELERVVKRELGRRQK